MLFWKYCLKKKERKKENPDQSGEGKYFLPRNEKCTEKFWALLCQTKQMEICQQKMNWRAWGCKQLSVSYRYWCSCSCYKKLLLPKEKKWKMFSPVLPRNHNAVLFNESVFPDRRVKLQAAYISHMHKFGGMRGVRGVWTHWIQFRKDAEDQTIPDRWETSVWRHGISFWSVGLC